MIVVGLDLVPTFDFGGFYQPVASEPAVNTVKAGSAVPVKFSLSGDQGLEVVEDGSPVSQSFACGSSAAESAVGETASAGKSGLTYDPTTGLYTYVWKTDRSWAGACRVLTIRLVDGTEHVARFRFTR